MAMNIDWDSLTPEQQEGILNSAAGLVPDGVQQHLGNPPTQNTMSLAVLGVSLFLVGFVAAVRVYSKVFCTRKVRFEDVLGLLAFGGVIGHAWSIIALAQAPGLFVHNWDVRIRDLEPFTKTLNLLRLFYCLINLFAKNAILLEWIHVFVPWPTRTKFFWFSSLLIAGNTALYIGTITATFLNCVPAEAMWRPWVKGRCINRKAADVTVMVFNLLCDLFILILPQSIIWKLEMKQKRKIGVSILFSLGILTCACAAGRVYSGSTLDYKKDAMFHVPKTILWGVGESTFVMMVFCIPAFPKAFGGEGSGLGTRLGKSLRSWAQMASGSRGSRSQGQSITGSQKTWPKSANNRIYRKMNEGSEVALTNLSTSEPVSDKVIMRTTELGVEENRDTEPGRIQHQTKSRQHPWMEGP